jgi:amino acid adenylation domain-containing protein
MQEALDAGSASRALGRPMANSRAYLLDAAMEPVPVGVTGELFIGGVQVTRGYIGRPALTAERYVPNPFGAAGDRLYRTGDLGRWRGDGTIQFAGRADFQVKVRGFRVELGEIEARLRDHPDVHEAVVLAREDAAGDKRLVAYVVGGDGARPEVLRAHLDGMLPEYMVPAAYVRLQALPLTSTGKLDRKALPAPDSRLDEAGAYEAPIGETEHALAEIWSEVLSIDRVSRHDHFFELGGHSLMAVQVISRVQQRLMVDVDLGELFSQPTLKDFARKLETAPRAELPPIERESRPEHSPLSFAQQRLWFLEQLQDLGSTYHVPWRHRLRGTLDRSALKRALDRIVARHEALRTTFVQVEGVARQKIASPDAASFLLIEHDLTGLPDAPAELKRVTAEEFLAPFDLERGPLVRGRLVKLAADDHVLLVTMHHIVSDAWSTTVIAREMTALYDAFRRGEPDPLPALDVHYADYAAWQRRWVDGDRLQQQSNYWVETLAGASGLLQVPTDHPRPAAMDHVGAQLPVQLDPELTEALKALGRRHGTTLFMTLLTGWAIVLGRLSRQDDLVIGTPTANRGRPEIEPLIGFFVNTLALRVDLSGSPTVGELLGRVKARAIHAQRHQDIPFEKIVELVDPARSMSHTPLFQAMFAWQSEMPGDDLSFAGVRQGTMGSGSSQAPAKFDLSLSLRETGGRIAGALVYATALFERDTVTRHAGYLQFVLKQMAADDRQPVDRLAMLPESERALLVQQGNGPHADYPRASSVHGLFEAQVERTPAAEAVVFEETRLTYAELNARANRLAHHLIALGVGPDVRVGICVQRSLDMVVGMLAVLKAGGGYVPLDPSYPPDHLAYMMDDSAPVAILTHTHVRDRVANASVRLIELDTASPRWADRPSTNPGRRDVGAGHLAYMTYTSGSTGRPKGVFNPHGASLNRLSWMQERHGLRAGEGVLQNSAFSFDASVFEIFWPLTVGGRLIVPRPGAHHDPEYLVQLISGERVTTAYFVVSMLQLFLEYPGVERCAELTRVFCGGEALSTSLADRVREQLPRVRLHNMYGPTESAVSVSGEVLVLDEGVSSAPIGRPVPNVRVYLLDEWGEPVPMGVAGELHVAGVQLARGYHNRPELTAERFVADPFCGEPGARMYRTGDLARWRADGTIEFLGRVDLQVKMRGYRIEPGEIEARLVEHPSVREAAVLVREDTPGDVRLVAYWTGEELEAEILREHLSAMLPSYMVPSAYMRLEHLPLTPSGKLNRAALPAPVGLSTRSYQPPEGRSEQALARIWAEVLRAERVGRHDDFFALGGHSLLAVQVIARVREALKREATLGALFTWPVLKDFAQQLGTAARATLPPIEAAPRTGRIPLSFAQRRLWFLEQLGGLGSTYHLRRRLTFREELDRRALVSALDAMVARHESLRTTFAQVNGVPEQHIAPADIGFHLVEHDLRGRADAAAELRRLTIEEARAPFDLTLGPLARGRLIRIAADEHVLLLTVHHVISDGWSMGVFTRELRALYGAFRNSKPNPLPALPVQYADYAAWQQRWVAGEVIEQQADYWTRTLAGAPELLELPTDHPRPSRMHHAGAAFGVELDEALTAGLKALARRHGTTLFMTIMAGWATVLGRLSGQDDVVIGTPAAGRGRREIEGLIGFFVNTLALRFDLSGAPTVAELLKEVKARTLAAQEHQDIPFEQVVEVVAPARSLSHSPIFQAMFVWLDASWVGGGRSALARFEEGGEPGGASTESPDGQAQLEITLALSERAGRITGAVEYMTALFERETVERYVGYLRQVLETMVADDQQRVDRLRVLPERERVQVVEAWNDTDTVYPAEACIHDLFEAQVARTPNALAVTFGDRSLTYAELNARANRLAHHLGACGVEPEARVGLCMERSLEMVIGLLAVLKAGGAYVPLDPADPVGRVEAMLADCAPVVVLTQGALAERLNRVTVPILAVDADAAPWRDRPATNPPRAGLTPDHLAYIIYTSGSTGQPKGAMNAHRGVVNRLRWMQDAYGLGAGDAVPQKTPYTFDVSVWEFFWTLGVGARLVVAQPEGHKDPAYLATLIHDAGITTMHFVPSMLQLFLDAADLTLCTSLKRVVCSGEALPPALMARFHARLPGVALINLYGPTEAAVDVTEWPCEPGADTVSLGRPIANTRTYVLDGRFDPVPVGVIGELFIGGVQVARGYCNRPALTADRFVADPFGGTGARLYRTGDRVRWRPDGTLEYAGRADFQTKIRGVRIEPGEIEARLLEHAGVREAAVLVRENTDGDKRLVAYVVGDETASAEGLRAHLRETLPEYMVPAAYVPLPKLPLTQSGKLDRKALPAAKDDAYARRPYEPPLGDIEMALAGIWAELLHLQQVGRWDNFFALGGHSLLVVQVVSRVRQVLEVELPLITVFEQPTLAALANQILDLQLSRFDPETLAQLALLVRRDDVGTAAEIEQ